MRDFIYYFATANDKIDVSALGFTGITSGTGTGTVLGYTHTGGDTLIADANSTFSIMVDGTITLSAAEFIF